MSSRRLLPGSAGPCERTPSPLFSATRFLTLSQSIHGYFTSPGIHNRPFVYAVSPIAISRAFGTASVIARQPTQPSNNPAGDYFPLEDASLPLGGPCYHAICSFKAPEPDSWGVNVQEDTPQVRFAGILAQRKPQDWPPSPPADIDGVVRLVGDDIVGTFPMVEMRKVDMTAYNRGKPVGARRELVLYRLLAPLPADGAGGWDANAHVAVHGFVVDRNGLLMLGNHVGFGESFGRAASLSYSLVVHTAASEAVMRFDEQDEHGNGWWVQEACFPRAAAGRGVIMSKIWSPRGVHVMTEYQDGLCKGMVDKVKI